MLQIFVTDESSERYEITDLYWFEEQGVHGFKEEGGHGEIYKFEFFVNGILVYTQKPMTICTDCEIHHYDNCSKCFGFGVYKIRGGTPELFPTPAGRTFDDNRIREFIKCPECNSTILGIPK